MADKNITELILITTLIFLTAPLLIVLLIYVYNGRKKRHLEEKAQMKLSFDSEIIRTQLEITEQTLQTIGSDLHDNIGQLLSLTTLTLNSISLDNTAKAGEKIATAVELTTRSIKEMRSLGKLLQGDQLLELGLSEAIRHQINWMERSGKFKTRYTVNKGVETWDDPEKDLILFRILQEVFNNVIKHSGATELVISLSYTGQAVVLGVSDNGTGFDTPGTGGMGLVNIRKRAGMVNGTADINSATGKGTTIIIIIPYP